MKGVTILVCAATVFSFLADRFGATRSVKWALFFNAIIYACHPFAALAQSTSRAGTWALISIFAVGRGCMGPVVMGGVSLILNNSSPRDQLGAVNGFAMSVASAFKAVGTSLGASLYAYGLDRAPSGGVGVLAVFGGVGAALGVTALVACRYMGEEYDTPLD